MARLSKANKTYRQDPLVAQLIEQAAEEAGVSQSEIVDECVLAQVQSVVRNRMRQRAALQEREVMLALADFITRIRAKK